MEKERVEVVSRLGGTTRLFRASGESQCSGRLEHWTTRLRLTLVEYMMQTGLGFKSPRITSKIERLIFSGYD